jgi:hypothetical protein
MISSSTPRGNVLIDPAFYALRCRTKFSKMQILTSCPHEDVADAHRNKRTIPVEVKAEHDDFREVRFYKRGRHVEQLEVSEWFGVRRREVEIEVFDDIVLLVRWKDHLSDCEFRREDSNA